MKGSHEHGRSSGWSSKGSARENAEEDEVYVAVVKDVKEGKANFLWLLHNTPEDKKVVVVHVHRPAQKIPTDTELFLPLSIAALGWIPASHLQEEEVAAYRSIERANMHGCLDEYITMCSRVKVKRAGKLVIEKDDVRKGLVELVAQHGITQLVMGAAADKYYSRRMKGPRSKTALAVQQQADPSCKIWFVCKGNLICTRDACVDEAVAAHKPTTRSADSSPHTQLAMAAWPGEGPAGSSTSGSGESSVNDTWDVASRASDHSLHGNMASSPEVPPEADRDDGSLVLRTLPAPGDVPQFQSPQRYLEDLGVDGAMYERLEAALKEADNTKREAYEELHKRQIAEKDLSEAARKVDVAETAYNKEVRQRKEIEEAVAKDEMQLSALRKQRDEVNEELQQARQKMAALELQISDSDQILKDIKAKLPEAYSHLDSIRGEHELSQQERVHQKNEEATTSTRGAEHFSEFSLSELEQATENFHEASKIGEGGYGCVYKGSLRHTTVAIKRLNPQGKQRTAEFRREIDILSRVRHPNLVTLIGACPEARALVYEYLPGGSLEDHLTRKLTWQVRIRIAAEICSALVFLHSRKPLSVVHGDLKPVNILLDSNFVSKISDLGMNRLLVRSIGSSTLYHCMHLRKGTFAYMDPELLSSGEITAKSDVYSFGVILLQLLTGRAAFGVSKVVKEALDMKCLERVLDASAGDWPYVQAEKLAKLGLKCCDMNRRNRPDAKEAWKMLQPLMKSISFARLSPSSIVLAPEYSSCIPSYFICPIFKELMRDPQIAADGFTYEGEAIKGWLSSGNETSPMTNLRLSDCELLPNHALRSAIQGWLQHQN
ncbi:U-box domain-containing protein 33 isoform X1 [Musa acuminata AAA Group]|uniref:U-box domain-containing protein 33 isoform X1 n=1 Tax=Musa acuminata AAA Group TaxID=214697 RepID=UPI0031DC5D65